MMTTFVAPKIVPALPVVAIIWILAHSTVRKFDANGQMPPYKELLNFSTLAV